MALKARRKPKIQRGLSLSPELYARIQAEADKYGLTWNETIERVLMRVFLASSESRNQADLGSNMRGAPPELVEVD